MKKTKLITLITLSTIFIIPSNVYALTKEETVYTKLNSNGDINNTIVYEHLINDEKIDLLKDITDLDNIVNINDNKKFSYQDNTLTWYSNTEDIFYKGTTNKKLPITEIVTYTLDNKEISLNDLLGKSGHIEINIKYINNDIHYNNKYGTMYTPFTIITTTNIKEKNNTNIKVTNGKTINTGNNTFILGLSTPGLSESLDINEKYDTITISYDTTYAETSSIYSIITPNIISNDYLDIFNKLDNIYNEEYTLQNSMNEIEKGSNDILNGIQELSYGNNILKDKFTTILDNINKLEQGSLNLDTGIKEIITKLNESIKELNSSDNIDKINSIKTLIDNNTNTIDKLTNINKTLKEYYNNYNLSSISYEYILNSNLDNKQDLYNIKYNYENTYTSNENIITLLTLNNEALNTSLNTFNETNTKINSMITTLNQYLNKTQEGSNTLYTGLNELNTGMILYNTKLEEINTGLDNLNTGMTLLNDGIIKINEYGIKSITNYINILSSKTDRLEILTNYSNSYQSFSQSNNINGTTKFINVLEGSSKEISKPTQENNITKQTFLIRLKNLFK